MNIIASDIAGRIACSCGMLLRHAFELYEWGTHKLHVVSIGLHQMWSEARARERGSSQTAGKGFTKGQATKYCFAPHPVLVFVLVCW